MHFAAFICHVSCFEITKINNVQTLNEKNSLINPAKKYLKFHPNQWNHNQPNSLAGNLPFAFNLKSHTTEEEAVSSQLAPNISGK